MKKNVQYFHKFFVISFVKCNLVMKELLYGQTSNIQRFNTLVALNMTSSYIFVNMSNLVLPINPVNHVDVARPIIIICSNKVKQYRYLNFGRYL